MLFTLKQASEWASQHLQKNVTPANINYLIQHGRIESVVQNGVALIPKESLVGYYNASLKPRSMSTDCIRTLWKLRRSGCTLQA